MFCIVQSYDEIIRIIKSLPSVKGVRLEVRMALFGVEWAASQEKATCVGIVDRWKTKNEMLMIKWEGWHQNKQCSLTALEKDSDGDFLELKLLPYEDGRPAPTLVEESDDDDDEVPATLEEDSEDEDFEVTTKNPVKPLGISSQTWRTSKPQGVNTDARTQPRDKPSLTGGNALDLKDIASIFHYLYPTEWIDLQLKHTNPKLQGHDALNAKLEKGELLQFWGYCLHLSLNTGIPIDQMWSTTPQPDSMLPPPAIGQHGMTLNRFKKIRSVLSFGPSDEATLRGDHWAFVRGLVDAYNKNRADNITAGWLLTADETMFAWRGQVGKLDPTKCPHRSWVPRKPEPLGVEMKTLGDALSGVMLRMEICEGAEPMKQKEFSADWGATTACTLRLGKPWFGSQRVLAADSWFSGVKTTRALLDKGLHHIGDVKTNSSLFSKDKLVENTPEGNGAWATCTAKLKLDSNKEVPIFSVSHRRGESIHTFISTCGTTLKGNGVKAYFEDDEERANVNAADYLITRECPCVLNDYTVAQPCLDRHNRYRQFILAMEKRLVTTNFSFRFGTSMHGCVFTDAFFALRYFVDANAEFKREMSKLAYALTHNAFLPPRAAPSPDRTSPFNHGAHGARRSPSPGAGTECEAHELVKITSLKDYHGGKQQRCIICDSKTIWCCATCTTGAFALVPMCPEATRWRGMGLTHHCLQRHRENPARLPRRRGQRGAKRPRAEAEGGRGNDSDDEGD